MCEGVLGIRIDSFVEGFREGYKEKTGKECKYSYDKIKLIALISIFKRDMIDIFQAAEQADITVQEFEKRLKSNIYDEIPPKVINLYELIEGMIIDAVEKSNLKLLTSLVKDDILTLSDAAERAGMNIEKFGKKTGLKYSDPLPPGRVNLCEAFDDMKCEERRNGRIKGRIDGFITSTTVC